MRPGTAPSSRQAPRPHRPLLDDVHRYGQAFWSTFNASRDELLWYYTSVERAVAERLPGSSIADALHRAVDELLAAAGIERSSVPPEMPEGNSTPDLP